MNGARVVDFLRWDECVELGAEGAAVENLLINKFSQSLFVKNILPPDAAELNGMLSALVAKSVIAIGAMIQLEAMGKAISVCVPRAAAGAGLSFF